MPAASTALRRHRLTGGRAHDHALRRRPVGADHDAALVRVRAEDRVGVGAPAVDQLVELAHPRVCIRSEARETCPSLDEWTMLGVFPLADAVQMAEDGEGMEPNSDNPGGRGRPRDPDARHRDAAHPRLRVGRRRRRPVGASRRPRAPARPRAARHRAARHRRLRRARAAQGRRAGARHPGADGHRLGRARARPPRARSRCPRLRQEAVRDRRAARPRRRGAAHQDASGRAQRRQRPPDRDGAGRSAHRPAQPPRADRGARAPGRRVRALRPQLRRDAGGRRRLQDDQRHARARRR